MPKVSVIVPVYNVEKYLEKCLDSIIFGTFKDIEIILAEDGSDDKSLEICKAYAEKDNRILVETQSNGGVYGAVIRGILKARSRYTVFVDSDDYVKFDYVERLYATVIEKNTDAVHTGFYKVEPGKTEEIFANKSRVYNNQEIKTEILESFFEQTASTDQSFSSSRWAKIFKTDILQKATIGANQNLAIGEDLDLNLRFLLNCQSIAIDGDYIGYYYISKREGSITNLFDYKRLLKEQLAVEELKRLAVLNGYEGNAIDSEAHQHLFNYLNAKNNFFDKLRCVKAILSRVRDKRLIIEKADDSILPIKIALKLIADGYVTVGTMIFHVIVYLKNAF